MTDLDVRILLPDVELALLPESTKPDAMAAGLTEPPNIPHKIG